MKNTFVKKFWEEEKILFYLHFQDDTAVRQVELSPNGKIFLSSKIPMQQGSMLYDQTLEELELNKNDFITQQEFEEIWDDR